MACPCAAGLRSKYDPCIDNEVVAFLNRRDVQRALNVPTPARPNPAYEVGVPAPN